MEKKRPQVRINKERKWLVVLEVLSSDLEVFVVKCARNSFHPASGEERASLDAAVRKEAPAGKPGFRASLKWRDQEHPRRSRGQLLWVQPCGLSSLFLKKWPHTHVALTPPTTSQQSPEQKQRHTNNSGTFWERCITTYWLKLSNPQNPALHFKHPVESVNFPLKGVVSETGTHHPLKLCGTRWMRV